MNRVAVLIPLMVGSSAIASTIVIHGAALTINLRFLRNERTLGHVGLGLPPALTAVLAALRTVLWSRAALHAEVLALRHQLVETGVGPGRRF